MSSTLHSQAHPLDLHTAAPFGIARWTHSHFSNYVVELRQGGVTGFGDGCAATGGWTAGTTGAVTVRFADLSGGKLTTMAALANEIVGLQWQFQSPAPAGDAGQLGCAAIKLTVDDVSFVP